MDLSHADWRLGILAAVALLAVYLIHAGWRLRQLKRPPVPPEEPPPLRAEAPVAVAPVAVAPEPPPPVLPPPDFAMRQFVRGVEAELEQVRAELAALREEVAHLKTLRQTSPHYAEAVALAGQGADPRTVAEQCGISQSEAELVLALARRREPPH